MRIYTKAGLATLALVLSAVSILAQRGAQGGPPQGAPRPGQQDAQYSGGFGPRGPMAGGFGPGMRMRMGGRGMGMRDGEMGAGRMLMDPAVRERLGITADQTAKMHQQESDFRKAEIRDRADLQIKRIDLDDLLAANSPNRAAIDAKLQEVGAAQLALEKAAIDFRLNIRDTLTTAQRDRLRQMMTEPRRLDGNVRTGGPQDGGRGGQRGGRGAGPAPGAGPGTNTQGQPSPPNR